MLESIVGAFVGLLYGAFGYAVAKARGNEDFSPRKFAKTLVIGFILGGASSALGIDIETLEGMSVVGFWTVVIDKIAGFITKPKTE